MILTTLLLFCSTAISADAPRTPTVPPSPSAETKSTAASEPREKAESAIPDAPTPKAGVSSSASKAEFDLASGGEAASTPAIQPVLISPVKPATTESYETPRQRAIWYGLIAVSHGTAGFDAWTTRRAISGGYGVEGDPLQRPFANSGAIYATTQVTPLIMDYLGHRMMRSSHQWIRKAWWVPQAASASVSLGAGLHNYYVIP